MNEVFDNLIKFGENTTGLSVEEIKENLHGSLPKAKETPTGKLIVKGRLEELRKRLAERQAVTDPLTGLYNRRFFEQRIVEEMAEAERSGEPLCLIIVDLDFFKTVNDQLNHSKGNEVLKMLAKWLSGSIRRSDILCRWGGEEIAILLPGTHLTESSEKPKEYGGTQLLAEKLRRKIETEMPEFLAELGYKKKKKGNAGTVSIGACTLESGDTPDSFWNRADDAMYLAKHKGRNRVELAEVKAVTS